jgi:plasmid stabilization system protein ParE
MRLRISPLVPKDLAEISEFIAVHSPRYAHQTLLKIRAKILSIAKNPKIYRLRPEIAPEVRLAIVGNYIILFRVVEDVVQIERIVHGARKLRSLLSQSED